MYVYYDPQMIRHLAHLDDQDDFLKKQLNLLFYTMENEDQRIQSYFQIRKDYSYQNHIHYLHNEVTEADTYCFVKDHMLILKSYTKNNIFYDILYQSQQNYVILSK